MSWEMLNNEEYNEMTDLYSVGIILLQLLTGKKSIMLSTAIKQNKNLLKELETEILEKYDKDLFKLFLKLVEFKPENR
jgi:serine/threonine protein kinase